MAAVSHARPKPSPNVSIFHYFGKLKDPRRDHRKLHDLQDILFIAVSGLLAGSTICKRWFGVSPQASLPAFTERIARSRLSGHHFCTRWKGQRLLRPKCELQTYAMCSLCAYWF